jgi:hypothetical protein
LHLYLRHPILRPTANQVVLIPSSKERAEPDLLQRRERLGDNHAGHQLPPRRRRKRLRADGAASGQIRAPGAIARGDDVELGRWRLLRVGRRASFEIFDAQRVERAVVVHHRCPFVDGDGEEIGSVAQMRDEQVLARKEDSQVQAAKLREWLERRRVRGLRFKSVLALIFNFFGVGKARPVRVRSRERVFHANEAGEEQR